MVDAKTVSSFQHRLQVLLKTQASDGDAKWETLFSPRLELWCNALRTMSAYRAESTYNNELSDQKKNKPSNCVDAWLGFAL